MAVRVKICGLTRVDDVLAAVEAGADALGFVFEASSPRYVGSRWTDLLREVPPYVYRVAVFGPAPKAIPDGVHAVQAIWSGVQDQPKGIDRIGVFRLKAGQGIAAIIQEAVEYPAILLDAFDPAAYGGTGKTVDFELARQVVEASKTRVVLAGGLTPDNVADAIRQVQPFAVDVSSGVEESRGIKSAELVFRFVQAAKSAV